MVNWMNFHCEHEWARGCQLHAVSVSSATACKDLCKAYTEQTCLCCVGRKVRRRNVGLFAVCTGHRVTFQDWNLAEVTAAVWYCSLRQWLVVNPLQEIFPDAQFWRLAPSPSARNSRQTGTAALGSSLQSGRRKFLFTFATFIAFRVRRLRSKVGMGAAGWGGRVSSWPRGRCSHVVRLWAHHEFRGFSPPLLANLVHTHFRSGNAHKNVTFSKFLMHFHPLRGSNFANFPGKHAPGPPYLMTVCTFAFSPHIAERAPRPLKFTCHINRPRERGLLVADIYPRDESEPCADRWPSASSRYVTGRAELGLR